MLFYDCRMPFDDSTEQYRSFTPPEVRSVMFGLLLAMFLGSLDQTIVATTLSTMARATSTAGRSCPGWSPAI